MNHILGTKSSEADAGWTRSKNQNQGWEGAVSKVLAVQARRTESEYQDTGNGCFWGCTGDAGAGGPCSRLASQSISELQAKTHKTRWLAAAEWHTSLFSGLHTHVHTCTPVHTPTQAHTYKEKGANQKPLASSKIRQVSTLRPRSPKLLKIHKRNLL